MPGGGSEWQVETLIVARQTPYRSAFVKHHLPTLREAEPRRPSLRLIVACSYIVVGLLVAIALDLIVERTRNSRTGGENST
jgi:hypothetical protein